VGEGSHDQCPVLLLLLAPASQPKPFPQVRSRTLPVSLIQEEWAGLCGRSFVRKHGHQVGLGSGQSVYGEAVTATLKAPLWDHHADQLRQEARKKLSRYPTSTHIQLSYICLSAALAVEATYSRKGVWGTSVVRGQPYHPWLRSLIRGHLASSLKPGHSTGCPVASVLH
jgi:hypothetical protein